MTANVFLVAVSFPNFGRTVTEPVALAEFDPPPEVPSEFVDGGPVRLWGTRKGGGNREQYAALAVGDWLLFHDGDAYVGTGRIGMKFSTPWVSRTFWGYAPMELLYSVEQYREVDLDPSVVNEVLGVDPEFEPDGLHRVDPDRLAAALEEHASFEELLADLPDR